MSQKIASTPLLSGTPRITLPSVYGGSPDKPFMMRLCALGKRPMRFAVEGLPSGLTLRENIVSGICSAGTYPITVTAENALGRDKRAVRLLVAPDGMLRTPLLGFTTWNAYATTVTQKNVEETADYLVTTGLAEAGYAYVNLDSGWQHSYGGKFDAIQPNKKFPDMAAMYAHLHALGLKGGIYSTPMLTAWGTPEGMESIPGCTRGEADDRFADTMGGIGREHLEENNVRQWTEWNVDYLKYDWSPTEPINADLMKRALLSSKREIAFCTTVHAAKYYAKYWRKNCCSWRNNEDTFDIWQNIVTRLNTTAAWADTVCPGHFYDLDMLAIGPMQMNGGKSRLTENEELFAYTMHTFFPSPVQLSMRLGEETEYEWNLISNDEILALNQDALCAYPSVVEQSEQFKIFRRDLEYGGSAYAVFNLSGVPLSGTIRLEKPFAVRNVWEKADIGVTDVIRYSIEEHAAAVFRLHAEN